MTAAELRELADNIRTEGCCAAAAIADHLAAVITTGPRREPSPEDALVAEFERGFDYGAASGEHAKRAGELAKLEGERDALKAEIAGMAARGAGDDAFIEGLTKERVALKARVSGLLATIDELRAELFEWKRSHGHLREAGDAQAITIRQQAKRIEDLEARIARARYDRI